MTSYFAWRLLLSSEIGFFVIGLPYAIQVGLMEVEHICTFSIGQGGRPSVELDEAGFYHEASNKGK